MKQKECSYCNNIFYKDNRVSNNTWENSTKFCSRKCLNDSRRDIPLSEERKEYNRKWSTGRKHTTESLLKMRGEKCHLWRGGPKPKPKCISCGNDVVNVYAKRCGKCKIKDLMSGGEKSLNWQGGITKESFKIRNSNEYKEWRISVFERDNYTCIECGTRGCVLHADHINPFAFFPELRFDINNGRTLCVPCHKETDTYMVKARWVSKKNSILIKAVSN